MIEQTPKIDKRDEDVFCLRCGRKLKGEHSKKLGYGPHCYMLFLKERKNDNIKLFNENGANTNGDRK